jgi:hypothetical protein
MNAIKKCVKNLELLDESIQGILNKRINNINKLVLPKSLLRANTKLEEEK